MKPPYTITHNILELSVSISEKIGEIKSAHLNKPPPKLRRKNRIKTIQSSLKIEGNTLTTDQITALFENKRVIAPQKDIIEVKNAIKAYNSFSSFDVYNLSSLCAAHKILMSGLIKDAGQLRTKSVGIIKGANITHIAPPGARVKSLMIDLFKYLENNSDLILIKSCVFHYELEFIHPFTDGNGRIGRLWQTLILKEINPIFEYLPIESFIKDKQGDYYKALSISDKSGNSTVFIEFMLSIINQSLESVLSAQNITLSIQNRLEIFKEEIRQDCFTRKDYLRVFKNISQATASRDLKFAVNKKMIKKEGDKRTTKYKYYK